MLFKMSGPVFIIRPIIIGIFLLIASQLYAGDKKDIDSLFFEKIGGVEQAILVRGEDTSNPVMLRLHGGPGYPYFPYLPEEGKLKEIEKHFTMIYWEQRGTGASYSSKIKKKSMTTDQFIKDAHEVIQFARNLLNAQKVFVWGHSWGSNIGMLLADRYPEDLYAYIGTGQSVNLLANEYRCYNFALRKTYHEQNFRGYKKLLKIDTSDYTISDALEVRKWIYTYGGVVFNNGEERTYVDNHILKKIWHTPQYTFRNKLNIILHPYFSSRQLWDDMKKIDLFQQVPEIDVPVYFCLGRHDHIVSSDIAARYFDSLKTSKEKHLIWFEFSAHRPHIEETEKFLDVLIKKVLPETYVQQEYSAELGRGSE